MWELDHKRKLSGKKFMLFNCGFGEDFWVFEEDFWTARGSNQSILKEISPECSLEGLMLKLKLQYFDHLMWRADSLEKTLVLGKIEGNRRRGRLGWDCWMASLTQWTWVQVNPGSWWWTEAWHAAVHGVAKCWAWLSDWTELRWCRIEIYRDRK